MDNGSEALREKIDGNSDQETPKYGQHHSSIPIESLVANDLGTR